MRWAEIDPFDLLDLPEFIPRVSRLRARPAMRIFDQAIDDMIAARERDPEKDGFTTAHDILMLLVRARDADLVIALRSKKFAQTSSPSWPPAMKRRRMQSLGRSTCCHTRPNGANACAPKQSGRKTRNPRRYSHRLINTRAVVEEALRLYPPLAAISRMARNDDELAGMRVKAGTLVVISPYPLPRSGRRKAPPAQRRW